MWYYCQECREHRKFGQYYCYPVMYLPCGHFIEDAGTKIDYKSEYGRLEFKGD